jgi:hypothetical protein
VESVLIYYHSAAWLRHTSFFTGQDYIGQGYVLVQSSDIVSNIVWSKLPFILWMDEGNHHQLVGEGYLHRIIDDEVL